MPPLSDSELAEYLAENDVDLHRMTLAEFQSWLAGQIERASRRPEFQKRCEIRDLRARHLRRLNYRQTRFENALAEYESSKSFHVITEVEKQIDSLQKGVEGLRTAVNEGRADPGKLKDFEQRLAETVAERGSLIESSPEYRTLRKRQRSLDAFEEEIGLRDAEGELSALERQTGVATSSAGSRFEEISSAAVSDFVEPSVCESEERSAVLHGVTLGCARGELDQVVIIEPQDGETCEVRAVVEAKRNINDLVHGYHQRVENLSWFAGVESGFDPELYKTEKYPNGRFDSIATHKEYGEVYHFNQYSFRRYREKSTREPLLRGLYFVTERRPLNGLTGGELGRVLSRVSTDPRFDIERESSVKRFRKWTLSVVDRVQTFHVLKQSHQAGLADHIIFP